MLVLLPLTMPTFKSYGLENKLTSLFLIFTHTVLPRHCVLFKVLSQDHRTGTSAEAGRASTSPTKKNGIWKG